MNMGKEQNSCFDRKTERLFSGESFLKYLIEIINKYSSKKERVVYEQTKQDKDRRLQKYKEYLETLAACQSTELFSNGGVEYAAILMSILLEHTEKQALIFSQGFKAELITQQPYWSSLNEYLKNPEHKLSILVETDKYIDEEPLRLINDINNQRRANGEKLIEIKLLSPNGKKIISDRFGDNPCNFAIYDTDKFRFEYDPAEYKAYGSFNQPDNCRILADAFNEAFKVSQSLILGA